MAEASVSASAGLAAESAAEAELRAQAEDGFDFDAKAIAVASASAAAAGGCAALGVAPAAPLCAYVGGEVAAWATDNIAAPVAEFFSDLFGGEPPEESLIKAGSELQAMMRIIDSGGAPMNDYFTGAWHEIVKLAAQLGLTGYTGQAALYDLRATGLNLISRPDLGLTDFRAVFTGDGWTYQTIGPMPDPIWSPNWPGWFRAQFSRGFTTEQTRAWIAEYLVPWYERALGSSFPTVAAWIEARAIERQATILLLQELAKLPESEQQALRDWQALAALSPEEQEQLRQYAELIKLTPTERDALRALSGEAMPHRERERILEAYALGSQSSDPSPGRGLAAITGATLASAAVSYLPRFL